MRKKKAGRKWMKENDAAKVVRGEGNSSSGFWGSEGEEEGGEGEGLNREKGADLFRKRGWKEQKP